MSAIGLMPTVVSSCMRVLMPMAEMEITRHQRERSLPRLTSGLGTQPMLPTSMSTTKAVTNQGKSTALGSSLPRLLLLMAAMTTITGMSMATRMSLTTVAVSPASVDTP